MKGTEMDSDAKRCGCLAALARGVRVRRRVVTAKKKDPPPGTLTRNSLVHDAASEVRYLNASNRELVVSDEVTENANRPVYENKHSSQLLQFAFQELKTATGNFRPDSILGEGGFGYVFKGWIEENSTAPAKPGTGVTVAVKSLKPDALQGHREWVAEVDFLGQLHHPNLVKLVGYCIEDDQRLLVYEFMARGSLENHLFRSKYL